MIRAFICTWSLVGDEVLNPITQWLFANQDTAPKMSISMHYPDADANGVPGKPYVLVIVKGPPAIENFSNLSETQMIPAWRFSKPVSELTSNQREAVLSKIDSANIPRSYFAGVQTYGDFLKKIAKYFSSSHSGFGRHIEVDAAGEFE